MTEQWTPEYEPWRHGGWYVNLYYPAGGCGCVSRNFVDRKWRVVNWPHENAPTFPNRDAAARAEKAYVDYLDRITCTKLVRPWPDNPSITRRCAQVRGHDGRCTEDIDTPKERKAA